LKWENADGQYQPLPASVHIFRTTSPLDGKANIAYYLIADLKDRSVEFDVDTSKGRRLTPAQFYKRDPEAIAIVNTTFFSYETNSSLNSVIKKGRPLAYNVHTINGRGRDTLTYRHPFGSAIGISKKRKADIAWLFTDTLSRFTYAFQSPVTPLKDSLMDIHYTHPLKGKPMNRDLVSDKNLKSGKWRMQTAVGGGPVLLQNGEIRITNNEELKFAGKAIDDKHPRTAMGYTKDNKIIILVVQGRFPGIAEGASLPQLAHIFKDLGCVEALNLDGGGSSCLLVNGKETIKPSDAVGQRPVPAVFIIRRN
jgi:hypothetical protein